MLGTLGRARAGVNPKQGRLALWARSRGHPLRAFRARALAGPPFAVSETDLLGTDQLTSGLFCLSQQKDQGVFCGLLWLDLMETLEMGLIY